MRRKDWALPEWWDWGVICCGWQMVWTQEWKQFGCFDLPGESILQEDYKCGSSWRLHAVPVFSLPPLPQLPETRASERHGRGGNGKESSLAPVSQLLVVKEKRQGLCAVECVPTPRKYAVLPCGHLDFESAVMTQWRIQVQVSHWCITCVLIRVMDAVDVSSVSPPSERMTLTLTQFS